MKIFLFIIFSFFICSCKNNNKVNLETENKLSYNEFLINVGGEVNKPGLYRINNFFTYEELFKLVDLCDSADISAFNLSDKISSEIFEIFIYKISDNENKININKASFKELQTLAGIKESLAQNIIDYRKSNGYFKNIEEIMLVNGIKEKKFNLIKDYIYV